MKRELLGHLSGQVGGETPPATLAAMLATEMTSSLAPSTVARSQPVRWEAWCVFTSLK